VTHVNFAVSRTSTTTTTAHTHPLQRSPPAVAMFSRLTRRVSSVASVRGRCASTVAHVRTATWNQAPVWAAAGLAATAALFVSVDRRERAYAMELPDCVLPNALTEDQDPLNLSEDIKELQRHFAGASQEAFVFVKPAACNKKVVDMVRERFLRLGMRVSLQGLINAEEIDRKMLIDNHCTAGLCFLDVGVECVPRSRVCLCSCAEPPQTVPSPPRL